MLYNVLVNLWDQLRFWMLFVIFEDLRQFWDQWDSFTCSSSVDLLQMIWDTASGDSGVLV